MTTPHKHAELIKAWADGAEIECYSVGITTWCLVSKPTWAEHSIFRIKQEPKENTVFKRWVSLHNNDCFVTFFNKDHNVKFEFDENNNLVKVEMI